MLNLYLNQAEWKISGDDIYAEQTSLIQLTGEGSRTRIFRYYYF
ncbi:hypothetical protein CLV59_107344 [Chitinophaga dinghuensis]|uniref:Uncharacterized protein n=1 Tax=Chitinophaga dinghuensis TaxID=1539050 RepID=A0A327VT64_9BACT|nr:hypothetical protein CLV59_107344 [Chitinophaga dinghuensis]